MKKIALTVAAATLLFAGCKHESNKEVTAAVASVNNEKIKTVAIEKLKSQVFTNYITVQGKVDADENVTVSPEMGGDVLRLAVSAGDEVHKGQLLAELDGKVIQQGISELQTALELATTMYNKQKNLWDQQVGTEVQYLAAKNQKESLEKKMATLQQQLELTRIKSPIDGTVDESFLKIGQLAAPGFPAFRIVNFAHLKVKAEVPENYVTKVKKGNNAIVLFPDLNDSISAALSFSAKVISPMNRTFNVEVTLENAKEFRPNMIAVLKIIDYTTPHAIVVPEGTIQNTEEGTFVYLNKNGKATKVKVTVGHEYNGVAEITAGLNEGDELITLGYQDLNEGEAIQF